MKFTRHILAQVRAALPLPAALTCAFLLGAWLLPSAHAQYIATSNDNICAGDAVNLYVNVTGWYDDPTDSNPAD